ncbi:MAG: 23S rRNA (adenine(2030)-N(6))-methyltransferase RlmJ [Pseudomonadota bacterium]|nr:23S rRNA (adenine(2030)-N(6))-methyltransferase RlmJ [Pseudomonadota bacterium]
MFSYRHAFHAGNHADVIKHLTLLATLRHLMRKDSPLLLVDTHAGAGIYRLDDDAAHTSGEAAAGIARLQSLLTNAKPPSTSAPNPNAKALADYLALIASFNRDGRDGWRVYPGSPLLMHALMAEPARAPVHDRLKLFELHPTDAQALQAHIEQLDAGRQVTMARQDGFDGLKALLPPPPTAGGSRRALVLIDPSYEIKSDYAKVAAAIQDALKRFATGVYLVWYPIIPRPEAHGLPRRLKTLAQQAGRAWLHATLNVGTAPSGTGLSASGMFVVNPPHTLKAALDTALPQVLHALGDGRGRGQTWSVEAGGAG